MVYGLWFMVYSLWFMVYGLWFMVYVGGGQHFQSLPKSLPSHFRGRNEAWGQIPPPDWRAREVTKQLGSDGLGVWEVLGSDKP
jgi:hypothetical protein